MKPLAFDVGAYVGAKSREYLKQGYRVVAVEPNPQCRHALERLKGDVIVVQKAVGWQPGTTTLFVCRKAPAISTCNEAWKTGRFKSYKWTRQVTVDVTTLDELIRTIGRPEFIKLDVEGSEYEALMGLTHRVPKLSFEFTREFHHDAVRCMARLEALGYRTFGYSMNVSRQRHYPYTMPEMVACLEAMPELSWGDIYAE